MGLGSVSHVKNCTVKNALLWGMCRSHYLEFWTQSKLNSRIGHLVLAVFETLPVVGQIISLIELKAVPYCTARTALAKEDKTLITLPQPISLIPKLTTIVSQDTFEDVPLFWPTDLTRLMLTESEKQLVDYHVKAACRALLKGGELFYHKKQLTYKVGAQAIEAILPITLCIVNVKNTALRVLLFPKTVFAFGGERTLRLVYNLSNGTFLLKKRITGCFEESLLTHLQPIRAKRGMNTPIMLRTSYDKQNKPKRQIIEPIRDGTLSILFQTNPLSLFALKRDLIVDLLSDLKDLHMTCLSKISFSSTKLTKPDATFTYNAFHADIKVENTLVSLQNGKWRAELCDFGGGSADPSSFILSVGYTPPEFIQFFQQQLPSGLLGPFSISYDPLEAIAFNIKYGQRRDVWSMGLVMLSLLVERQETVYRENMSQKTKYKTKIAPLPCLKDLLSGRFWGAYDEKNILRLQQETLDLEIDQLEKETQLKHPERQFEVTTTFHVVKRMLRIDPNERITIDQSLRLLDSTT